MLIAMMTFVLFPRVYIYAKITQLQFCLYKLSVMKLEAYKTTKGCR